MHILDTATRLNRATNVDDPQAYTQGRAISSKIFSQRTKEPSAQASSSTSPTSPIAKPNTLKSTSTSLRSLLKGASTSFMRTKLEQVVLPTAQVKEIEGGAVIMHLISEESGGNYADLKMLKVAELGKETMLVRDSEKRARRRNRITEWDRELKGKEWDDLLPLSPLTDFPCLSKGSFPSSSTSTLFIEPSPPKKYNSDLSGSSSSTSNHLEAKLPRRPPRALFAIPSRKARAQIRRLHPIYYPAYELQDASPTQDSSSEKILFSYSDPAGAINLHSQNIEGNDLTRDKSISSQETKLLRPRGRAPLALQLPEVAASVSLRSNGTAEKGNRGLLLANGTSRCRGQDRIGFL